MKSIKILTILVLALCLFAGPVQPAGAETMGTAFTYQGRLIDANETADGLYDFQFKLYDAVSDGNVVGLNIRPEVDVIDGYFTTVLDFNSVFDGNARWLEIGVRPGELKDPNIYTILTPRQIASPTPYALYAASGTPGPQGPKGDKGDQGDPGTMGPQGPEGPTLGIYDSLGLESSGGHAAGDAGARTLYNLGNVGIGTDDFYPDRILTVNGKVELGNSLEIMAGYGSVRGYQFVIGAGGGSDVASITFGDGTGRKLHFGTNPGQAGAFSPRITFTDIGNVGIGTTNPARPLHVSDVIRLQPRATAPLSPAEGDIWMDGTSHKLKVYDGTTWQACW